MFWIFFFCLNHIVDSMSYLCCLKIAINEGLPTPSTESQSRPIWGHSELFCQIWESSPYFLESCCASPHSRLCVVSHLIYKVSIEICMRAMMPALKIYSSREYIDSSVIELSLTRQPQITLKAHVLSKTCNASHTSQFPSHSDSHSFFPYFYHSQTITLFKISLLVLKSTDLRFFFSIL